MRLKYPLYLCQVKLKVYFVHSMRSLSFLYWGKPLVPCCQRTVVELANWFMDTILFMPQHFPHLIEEQQKLRGQITGQRISSQWLKFDVPEIQSLPYEIKSKTFTDKIHHCPWKKMLSRNCQKVYSMITSKEVCLLGRPDCSHSFEFSRIY